MDALFKSLVRVGLDQRKSVMTIWEKEGMDQMTYAHLPGDKKKILIIRHNGVKIFNCCEMSAIKQAPDKWFDHLVERYLRDEGEKEGIKSKFPHTVFG